MLAYAAHQRSRHRLSPTALSLIIGGHAVAIGLLISAKMDVPIVDLPTRTKIYDVPVPPPPPPEQRKVEPKVQPNLLPPPPDSHIDRPPAIIPTPQPTPALDSGPAINSNVPDIGPALGNTLLPTPFPVPKAEVVRVAARPLTPPDLLRPPYPESMRRGEEEATLRLRLSIDARGRVTSVEPVGEASPAFVASARSHLIRYWRYRPATEDGKAVASTLVITLRFELED